MSAANTIIFFGIKFELREEEIEGVELRTDARVVTARRAKLNTYWGGFGPSGQERLLFVGWLVANLGYEGEASTAFDRAAFEAKLDETAAKLKNAGFKEQPRLLFYFQPDF